jgi:hypothetical protein
MDSQYVNVIAFFILTFIWFYGLGISSYWVICRHIRTKRAFRILNLIQGAITLIGCCFALLTMKSVYQIKSIPAGERSDDGFALFLGSMVLPMIAVFLTMKVFFPNLYRQSWDIRGSLRKKSDDDDQ